MAKNDNEQFFNSQLNSVRQELDSKIEKKVSYSILAGLVGILMTIIGAVLLYAFNQIGVTNSRIDDITKRIEDTNKHVIIIETKQGYLQDKAEEQKKNR